MRCVFMVVCFWLVVDFWVGERELVSLTGLPGEVVGLVALDARGSGGENGADEKNGAAGGSGEPAAWRRRVAQAVDDDFGISGGGFHDVREWLRI
jgi:hypothetical protein